MSILYILVAFFCEQAHSQVNYPYLDLKGSEYLDFLDGDEIVVGVDDNGKDIRYFLFIDDDQVAMQDSNVNEKTVKYSRSFSSIESDLKNFLNQSHDHEQIVPTVSQKTMTRGRYIAGGIVGTVAGLGIGHFIQGKNQDGGMILGSELFIMGAAAGTKGLGFATLFWGLRLIEIISIWTIDDWIVVDPACIYLPRQDYDLQPDIDLNNLDKNYNRIDVGIKIPFN